MAESVRKGSERAGVVRAEALASCKLPPTVM